MTWFLLFLAVSTAVMSFCVFWCGVSMAALPNTPLDARAGAWQQIRLTGILAGLSSLPMVWTFLQGAV